MDYSVVVQDGDYGFAAVTRGSYSLFDPAGTPEGYLDGKSTSVILIFRSKNS
jgi:hypothetical protein